MGYRIIFATDNEGKMWKIRLILADLGLSILSMKETDAEPEIMEDGTTFRENAEIKAKAVWNLIGDTILTDNSGLGVDYIDGEPGIYSIRYLGEDAPCEVRNRSIIKRLREAVGQKRGVKFVCSIAVMPPDGRVLHAEAMMEGLITGEPAGNEGFGYDPILYLLQFGKTFAEVTMERKSEISHRGKALGVMKEALEGVFK